MIISKQSIPNYQYASRFQIGQTVLFQPNLSLIDAKTGKADPKYAATAEIAGVAFSVAKVYYDLDVLYVENYGGTSTTFRTRLDHIPSDMICEQ